MGLARTVAVLATALAVACAAEWQPLSYKSGNLTILGILTRPPGPGPFPAVVVNHGGFAPAPVVLGLCRKFTEKGYVAAASDYRGCGLSQGKHEMAKGEVDDVLALIEHLKTLAFVDAKRIVMIGESHGGAITLLATARSPDVRAAVAVCAPSDLAKLCEHWKNMPLGAGLSHLKDALSHTGGTPEEVPDEYRIRSAITRAKDFRVPVLLIHGAKDALVPPAQSEAMLAALKAAGKTAELKIVPNCGHVVPHAAYLDDALRWFEKAIGPAAKGARPADASKTRPVPPCLTSSPAAALPEVVRLGCAGAEG